MITKRQCHGLANVNKRTYEYVQDIGKSQKLYHHETLKLDRRTGGQKIAHEEIWGDLFQGNTP